MQNRTLILYISGHSPRESQAFFEAAGERRSKCKVNSNVAVRLLLAAGILMLLAGCIFGFTQQWIYAALVWVGAFGCMVAALNFKNRKGE